MSNWPWLLVVAGGLLAFATARGSRTPMRALTLAEERRLGGLVPSAQIALQRLRLQLHRNGIETFVGQTRQDQATAEEMFSTGRSATRTSWHLVGRAVDLYVVVGGQVDFSGRYKAVYERLGAVARAMGWRWLGTGTITNRETGATFTDPAHVEFREGLTWTQAAGQA